MSCQCQSLKHILCLTPTWQQHIWLHWNTSFTQIIIGVDVSVLVLHSIGVNVNLWSIEILRIKHVPVLDTYRVPMTDMYRVRHRHDIDTLLRHFLKILSVSTHVSVLCPVSMSESVLHRCQCYIDLNSKNTVQYITYNYYNSLWSTGTNTTLSCRRQ